MKSLILCRCALAGLLAVTSPFGGPQPSALAFAFAYLSPKYHDDGLILTKSASDLVPKSRINPNTRWLRLFASLEQVGQEQVQDHIQKYDDFSSYYTISTSNSGPSEGLVHTLTIHKLPGQKNFADDQSDADAQSVASVLAPVPTVDSEIDKNAVKDSGETSRTDDMNQGEKTTLHKKKIQLPEHPIVIETGKIGRQAAGAVTLARGDTVLYATASRDDDPKENIDFLPLSVEHQERFSSAGLTSGSYNKRDGRPAEHEVLTCRLIDRPLRPLIVSGWRHETQLLSWVLSYDGERSCDPLAIIASATALYLSDVPLLKPVAAVMVGYDAETGELLLNPTHSQMENSTLSLIVAGTKDAVLMIEGAADFLPEAKMIEAVTFGHNAISVICASIEEYSKVVGVTKKLDTIAPPVEGLQARVDEIMTERVDAMYAMGGTKTTQGPILNQLQKEVQEELAAEFPDKDKEILGTFKDLLCRRMFERAKTHGVRCDGRKMDEIRRLDMETGLLPRVHGSALFTRGETQALATATLGGATMRQKIDKIDGTEEKRFYLQYTFPPSCVGETGRVGAPGRREIGHGNLAERALIPTLPGEGKFPYTVRVESLVTESHGSSSMASVCSGCLALMDAGVPIKSPVAGIAMGMLLGHKDGISDDNAIILSDILGTEDALGTMDFKVAGDRNGITTFQLDIKCEGLTISTMQRALEQARIGRLYILDAMDKVLSAPRSSLPDTVPKMSTIQIPFENIGKVIGPGGKQIRAIIEDFNLESMDVNDEGEIQLTSFSLSKIAEAEEFIMALIAGGGASGVKNGRSVKKDYAGPPPVEGQIYTGKITGLHNFGVFLEFMPGAEDGSTPGLEGLCHVSELAQERIRNCEGFVRSLGVNELDVMYLGKSDKGKIQLSRKAALEAKKNGGVVAPTTRRQSLSSESSTDSLISAEPEPMTKQEIDVIARAIQGINKT